MRQQDSLAMATSEEQRQQGAGHAMPAGKATSDEQNQVGIATIANSAEGSAMLWVILLCCIDSACATAMVLKH